MSKTQSIKIISTAPFFTMAILMILSNVAAEECKTINIISGNGLSRATVMVKPDILSIAKGECVVWANRTRVGDVRIKFEGEKNCEAYVTALSGFALDPDSGCYIVDRLKPGGTASVAFKAEGMYHYVVEFDFAPTRRVYGKIGVIK